MAENGREIPEQTKNTVDKEVRLRHLKERQNEERQKKLEEIKSQALAAQRFKEQKEHERRKRLEDMRVKDDQRRVQVEERKRAINEAERDRLESILHRNNERHARIETKKRHERSNIVFAFGSSTPRMLDPTDMSASFWGHRRATSTQNITSASTGNSLTRRQSERDLDAGSKKRATSAGGLERAGESFRGQLMNCCSPVSALKAVVGWNCFFRGPSISGTGSRLLPAPEILLPAPEMEGPLKKLATRASETLGSNSNRRRPLDPKQDYTSSMMYLSDNGHFLGLTSPTTPAGCASGYLGRRRTDLVPTIPSRDSSFHSSTSRKSLNHSPGRAYSMTRLDQLAKPRKPQLPALNESNMAPKSSVTRSMSHLAHVGTKLSPRKPLSKADSRSMHQLSPDAPHPPVAPPRVNRATQLRQQKLLMAQQSSSTSEASSRPSSSLSQQSTNSVTSSLHVKHRISNTPRRPRPASIAVTGVTYDRLNADKGENKPPLPKTRKSLSKTNTSEKIEKGIPKSKPVKSPVDETAPKVVSEDKKEVTHVKKLEESVKRSAENETKAPEPVQSKEPTPPPQVAEIKKAPLSQVHEEVPKPLELVDSQQHSKEDNLVQHFINTERKAADESLTTQVSETVINSQSFASLSVIDTKEVKVVQEEVKEETKETGDTSNEMTTSMSKPRITTEEEAKAALAERRRLIREETERQAELERQRIEAEHKAELERQLKEEEQLRLLAEMQREAEQERLQEAIKEAQKREEEERLRKEEEQKQKILKEEADQKAREEAERQKAELQKKLENEEKEREERRKRVEMIMSRTRGKNNANNLASQQNSQDKNENASDEKEQVENKLIEENKVNENKLNGTKQENGTETPTKNGKDVGIVDNIIPDESVKNANTVTDTINTDSINTNSAWQPAQQYDIDAS